MRWSSGILFSWRRLVVWWDKRQVCSPRQFAPVNGGAGQVVVDVESDLRLKQICQIWRWSRQHLPRHEELWVEPPENTRMTVRKTQRASWSTFVATPLPQCCKVGGASRARDTAKTSTFLMSPRQRRPVDTCRRGEVRGVFVLCSARS